ncbi:MAG: MFS transporter [Nanoarchaeota archaeon]
MKQHPLEEYRMGKLPVFEFVDKNAVLAREKEDDSASSQNASHNTAEKKKALTGHKANKAHAQRSEHHQKQQKPAGTAKDNAAKDRVQQEIPARKFVAAFTNIFFYFVGFYLIKAMLPVLIDERMQLPTFIIAIIFSIRYFSCAIYDGFLVKVAKKLSLRAAAAIGIISLILVFTGFYSFEEFITYCILFALMGMLSGFNELTFLNKSQSWGRKGIQMYYGAFFAGTFLAFFASGFILQHASVEMLFAASGISFLIPLIIISISSRPHHVEHVSLGKILHMDFLAEEAKTFKHLKKNMVFIFFVKLFAEGFNSLKELFIPLIILNTFMGGPDEISLVLALTLFPSIIIQRNLKGIIKRIPAIFFFQGHKRRVLAFSLLLLGIGCIAIPFAQNTLVLGILVGLAMIGFSLVNPLLNIIILKYYPEKFERENALLHISAQLGKGLTLLIATGVSFFFTDISKVFIVPGIVFFLLLGYLFIDSFRKDEIKGRRNITMLRPEDLGIDEKE